MFCFINAWLLPNVRLPKLVWLATSVILCVHFCLSSFPAVELSEKLRPLADTLYTHLHIRIFTAIVRPRDINVSVR